MNKTIRIALIGAALLAVSACATNRRPPADVPDPGGYTDPNSGSTGGSVGNTVVPGSQADFVASVQGDTIYFDTDMSNIDENDRVVLQSQAQWLARYPNVRITLEGHADERGTREYNVALGERRANSARNYLASLGVDPARISVVSYGKERPVALGSDEASWAQNRRAVTVTVQR
jgi:peptidoglycan-associated lipoprotein